MSEDDEYILIRSDMKTAIIDVTSQSTKDTYAAINLLNDAGLTEVDYYVYTNYTFQTESAALKLANNIYVKNLYLPAPASDEENIKYFLLDILY